MGDISLSFPSSFRGWALAGQVTRGQRLPSTLRIPLRLDPLHFHPHSCHHPARVPSLLPEWPYHSEALALDLKPPHGFQPLEDQAQTQPDHGTLLDQALNPERRRGGWGGGKKGACGLTSLAKIQQWNKKTCKNRTLIVYPVSKAFCHAGVFVYVDSTSFQANGKDSGSDWSFEALL